MGTGVDFKIQVHVSKVSGDTTDTQHSVREKAKGEKNTKILPEKRKEQNEAKLNKSKAEGQHA